MRKVKRHLRCPKCQGLNTKRHGIRISKQEKTNRHIITQHRWYCKNCGHVFIPVIGIRETISSTTSESTELYFEEGASYRAAAHKVGIGPKTAYNKIISLGFNSKSPLETSVELKPKWSGYLIIDGDSILIGSHRESLLLGVDAFSQDIPHAILAEHEDGQNWTHLLLVLKDPIHYPFKGIISDGDPTIQEAIKVVLPGVPYQYCVRHFEQELFRYIRYRFTQKRGYWRESDRFLKASKNLLYANNFEMAKKYLLAISIDPGFKQAGLDEVINKIKVNFSDLTRHHFYPGMPRTSNIGEGVISRLDSKINQADGYKCRETAWATFKMLIMRYRFKVFTDCRKKNKHKNGKSPLELCGVDVSNINWIKFSQRSY